TSLTSAKWHIGDFGRDLILIRDALNNGHVSEAASDANDPTATRPGPRSAPPALVHRPRLMCKFLAAAMSRDRRKCGLFPAERRGALGGVRRREFHHVCWRCGCRSAPRTPWEPPPYSAESLRGDIHG